MANGQSADRRPHCSATITLHNPYLNFEDMSIPSTRRCLAAADAILDAYYVFQKATAYSTVFYPRPIAKLHPFATVSKIRYLFQVFHLTVVRIEICWYLAAVVKVQVCKYMIEIGEASREIEVWGEINALRSVSFTNRRHACSSGDGQECYGRFW